MAASKFCTCEGMTVRSQSQFWPRISRQCFISTQFGVRLAVDLRCLKRCLEGGAGGALVGTDENLISFCLQHTYNKETQEDPDIVTFAKTVYTQRQPNTITPYTFKFPPAYGPSKTLDSYDAWVIKSASYCPVHRTIGSKPFFVLTTPNAFVISDCSYKGACAYVYKDQFYEAFDALECDDISDVLTALSVS
jgi:hypothetical protein